MRRYDGIVEGVNGPCGSVGAAVADSQAVAPEVGGRKSGKEEEVVGVGGYSGGGKRDRM